MSFPPELQAALLGRRVVYLRGRLDSANANNAIAQLLLLAGTAPGRAVELYLDTPGGLLDAALALYDVMHTLGGPVSTTCIGTVGGAGVLILAAGSPGVRYALPHARVHLVDEPLAMPAGSPNQLAAQADEAARLRARWQAALASRASQPIAELARDLTAGMWLSAPEAQAHGLIDAIVPGGSSSPARAG